MNYLIFGGGGFIGTHLAKYIKDQGEDVENIYNLDINGASNSFSESQYADVRLPIEINIQNTSPSIIYNLAAVHTTPGHPDNEYFETNILGAQNVCDFARQNGINTIVFTSSIAPYGASEESKTEDTLPMPQTPYGISKLTAEYIHKIWQVEDPSNRRLIIIRPGVVFGQAEGGNFTRLYKALKKGFFFYPGRKNTIKAAIYVKDVVRILYESSLYEDPGVATFNLTYFPAPKLNEICETIARVTNVKEPVFIIPPKVLKFSASIIYVFSKLLGFKINGIHPERVRKLMISTNISGEKLSKTRYALCFSMEDAIKDWFEDCKKKGLH
jgi:nucleoside-diphosphate-sugar epimerase